MSDLLVSLRIIRFFSHLFSKPTNNAFLNTTIFVCLNLVTSRWGYKNLCWMAIVTTLKWKKSSSVALITLQKKLRKFYQNYWNFCISANISLKSMMYTSYLHYYFNIFVCPPILCHVVMTSLHPVPRFVSQNITDESFLVRIKSEIKAFMVTLKPFVSMKRGDTELPTFH